MELGLSKSEIQRILIQGFEEEVDERFEGSDHLSMEKLHLAIQVLRDRFELTLLANNKRLADQLGSSDAGVA